MMKKAIIGLFGLAGLVLTSCPDNEDNIVNRNAPQVVQEVYETTSSLNDKVDVLFVPSAATSIDMLKSIEPQPADALKKPEYFSSLIRKVNSAFSSVKDALSRIDLDKLSQVAQEIQVADSNQYEPQYSEDGQRSLPMRFVKGDNSCGEFGFKVLVGPDKWRTEKKRADIIRIFDHLVNLNKPFRGEDLCDRLVVTKEEVVCYQYECVSGCQVTHWPYALEELLCDDVNSVEKYSFRKDRIFSVDVEFFEVSNAQCRVKVGVDENGTQNYYSFTFVTEYEIKEFLELMGSFTKMMKWAGKKSVSYQYLKEKGKEPVIFPKKREGGPYGRILFSHDEMLQIYFEGGLTPVDSYITDKCPPGQKVVTLKSREEIGEMAANCRICAVDKEDYVDSYTLLNNPQKELCDIALLTKKELLCGLRIPVIVCFGQIEDRPEEGNLRGVVYGLQTTDAIQLSSIINVRVTHSYGEGSGYVVATLSWKDSETKKKRELPFVFERADRMEDFVRNIKSYAHVK